MTCINPICTTKLWPSTSKTPTGAQLGRMSPSKHEVMVGAHVTSHYRGGSADGINDIVPLCGKCNNGAGQSQQMLWIEDKCHHKEVDWREDVIYMYYRDLVKWTQEDARMR